MKIGQSILKVLTYYTKLEITSGAIREHRFEVLKSQIIEKGFKPEDFSSYLTFFAYGCPPHGGLHQVLRGF